MGSLLGDSPADSTETDEGEETAEESQRRQQWVEYYVSIGEYKEAEEIGWDLQYPPDPRQAPGGAEAGATYAANYNTVRRATRLEPSPPAHPHPCTHARARTAAAY